MIWLEHGIAMLSLVFLHALMYFTLGCEVTFDDVCISALMNSTYESCETVTQEYPGVWGVCEIQTCQDKLKRLLNTRKSALHDEQMMQNLVYCCSFLFYCFQECIILLF